MSPNSMLRQWIDSTAPENIAEHWHRLAFLESVGDPGSFVEPTGELLALQEA